MIGFKTEEGINIPGRLCRGMLSGPLVSSPEGSAPDAY